MESVRQQLIRRNIGRKRERVFRKLILYMLRWQLSTPIIGLCYIFMQDSIGATCTAVVANIIGSLIFFLPDMYIFKGK